MNAQDFSRRLAPGISRNRAAMALAGFAAVFVAAFAAGVTVAAAADLPLYAPGHFIPIGRPALPFVIFEYEPGIVVRPYWLPPWRHRHYFPFTGRLPRIGRREHLSAVRPKPAESYERTWSTSSAFVRERPRCRCRH